MSDKKQYRVRNWGEYNKALKSRGSLFIWFSEDIAEVWYNKEHTHERGCPRTYTDSAIECLLALRAVYHLPLRQTQGFAESLLTLFNLPIDCPDYTTLCRRQADLSVSLPKQPSEDSIHVVVDSTGLKVYGEGEWKVRKHGYSKRRTWRKLHLALDESTNEVLAMELTENDKHDSQALPGLLEQVEAQIDCLSGDGAYDTRDCYEALSEKGARPNIPPKNNAVIWQHGNSKGPPHPRDENLRAIRKMGRKRWKKESGYHRRSLSETAMFRFKALFGGLLNSRNFENQKTEALIKCQIMNKMTHLGMPDSIIVA